MSLGTKTDFAGRDGFHWWIGEVEDHMDPAQLGRVRVRIIGWYTGNRTKDDGSDSYLQTLPTEMLPWATVLLPTDKPQTKNGGTTTELQPGAEVLGFFLDGEEAQLPCVLGAFRTFRHAEGTSEGRGSSNQMSRTIIANNKIADDNATNTSTQTGLNNAPAFGGHPYVKAQGQTPGSATGGEEQSRGVVNRAEVETPFNVYTNPIGVPSNIGGIADGTTGPANEGFQKDLQRMLTDLGMAFGSIAQDSDGNMVSAITGQIMEGKAALNQLTNLTNFITNGISGMLAPLKEFLAQKMQMAIDLIMKAVSNFVPLIVVKQIMAIIQSIIQDIFCKPVPGFLSAISGIVGNLGGFLQGVMDFVMNKIDDMMASITDFVERAMKGIQSKICGALAAFNKIANTVLSAINTFKNLSKIADGISSIFSVNFSALNFSSILDIIAAIIGFIAQFTSCGRKSRKPRAKGWMPLLGTTECSDPGIEGPGGGDYSNCSADSFGGGGSRHSDGVQGSTSIFDGYFQDMNPFLMQTATFLNGARDIDDATPGKEKRVRSGPGGVTSFEDKRGNVHYNIPNNDTKIIGRDLVENVKGNHVLTVEGDYYLKVMGDFHIEVAGSMNEHTSNGPGAKAKAASDSSFFAKGSKWNDQGNDDPDAVEQPSGGNHFNVKSGQKEAKSVQTNAGDHDISYQGDITIQGARINMKGINAISLDAPEINNSCQALTNKATGEIINETNWITSFLACGRFDIVGIFSSALTSVVTGQYSLVKGAIVDVTMDLPFPGPTPPAHIRMAVGTAQPSAMADIVTGGSPGAHMTLVATPTGGIGEIVTAGSGAIINQVTTGLCSYGVGTGLAALGSALGPTQIYGLPVMLN